MIEFKYRFLRAGLRRLWMRYPARSTALKKARRPYTGHSKRNKWEYNCAKCLQWYKGTEVQIDHIIPCGRLAESKDITSFIERLFCDEMALQILCKPCHLKKTRLEGKHS